MSIYSKIRNMAPKLLQSWMSKWWPASNVLPFELKENSFTEILDSEPEKIWELLKAEDRIHDLVYRPGTFKGGEGAEKIYEIKDKVFEKISFSHTEISNLTFTRCTFVDCIFYRTLFDILEFHDCSFENCNFSKCRIRETYIDPSSFAKCVELGREANIGVHLFQQLMRNFKDLDQPDFYRGAEFMFRRFKRSQTWYDLKKGKVSRWKGYPRIFGNFLAQWLLGYGLRIWQFIAATIVLFLLFWAVNSTNWVVFGLTVLCDTCANGSWDKSLYYTAISLSNLGYGDIVPSSTSGRVWASFQAVIGAVWFAVMASMVFRRITSR